MRRSNQLRLFAVTLPSCAVLTILCLVPRIIRLAENAADLQFDPAEVSKEDLSQSGAPARASERQAA